MTTAVGPPGGRYKWVAPYKRRAVVALRDANEIDDIVLRELQAVLDAEEVRLLGPVPTD